MKLIVLFSIFLLSALWSHAQVALYYVEGLKQYPIEAASLAEWCEQCAQSGPPDEWSTARKELGVLYETFLKNPSPLQETLPKKIALKNYLRIKNYYLYTPVQESQEDDPQEPDPFTEASELPPIGTSISDSWKVIDQKGDTILSFKFCYGQTKTFPKVVATCVALPSKLATWDKILIKQNPDEWILYGLNKNKEPDRFFVLARGMMALHPERSFIISSDEDYAKEHLSVKQTDLIPVLREFMDIQMGRKKNFTDARNEILPLLSKARKREKDFRESQLKKIPPPAPQPKAPSFLPKFEETRGKLAKLLHFPSPDQYKPSEESGPAPNVVDHCREDWLKQFKSYKFYKESSEHASIWCHFYLLPNDQRRTHLMIAQCGTRTLALETLARMRFWEAQRWHKGPQELTAKEVAAQTNTSSKLVGDFSLFLKGGLDKFGNLSPDGPYSSIFFLRGTTAVGLVSDNPTRSVLPLAKKLDTELKKLRNRKGKYRKEKPVHYISPEDADKYKEFLKGNAPETGRRP